ncbi:MAG: flagellar protein FlaG [Planctomycetota bacterium]|nr:MAG: flagellar protein FlaG [Planctomycetota bacterium]
MVDFGVPRTGENVPNIVPPETGSSSASRQAKKPAAPRIKLPPLADGRSDVEITGLAESREALSSRIAEINEVLRSARKSIRFRMPDMTESGPLVVEVIDPETNEVIRTIPSDRVLRVKNQIEVMMGLVFDGEF